MSLTCKTSAFHKKTYTGLLLNCFSFVPNCYKLGLIKTLVDQMYRINNSWTGFDKYLKDVKNILKKNQYPLKMIDHIVFFSQGILSYRLLVYIPN